ncbi:extracellular solute-binding protein [Cohnella thailandensis]|uniref:Extracellular solute-binding protein n=1 Tax=Cohnella thailandensis TaxID=557557 RepID=A0A841SPD5_9BACL|nr:extracellular solute-binding protein [Cohnella thailandensis]MBB6632659.1 extracellular solute-binding protein [Cohnella thailandensis]MBP1975652.1 multiple sugar transport system substrate-binding protein [Cohnella thailandensis]
MTNRPKRTTFKTRMDDMIAALENDIVTGKYAAGDLLPSEIALGEQFQLSKKSVRKAIDTLVEQGFVEKQPRIGARVVNRNPANRTTVKFGYYPTLIKEANLLSLIDAFHERYPQIRVEMIPLSSTLRESMEREAIDLITVNLQDYELFLDSGTHPESLEPLATVEGVYPFLTKPFTADGALYVQPLVFSPIVLCYNKRHFQEAGLSEPDSGWTWADVVRANEALSRERERLGFLFNLISTNRWPLFLLQDDFKFKIGPDGKTIYRDEQLKRCLETCLGFVEDSMISLFLTEEEVSERLFAHQKASMIVTSYFRMNALRKSGLDFDISPVPYAKEARTLLIVIGLAINKRGASKQAAKTLMEFLLSPESQQSIRKDTLSIPSLKSAAEYQDPKNANPLRYSMFRDIIPSFRYHVDLNATSAMLSRMNNELLLYWTKMENADSILRRLEATEHPAPETPPSLTN